MCYVATSPFFEGSNETCNTFDTMLFSIHRFNFQEHILHPNFDWKPHNLAPLAVELQLVHSLSCWVLLVAIWILNSAYLVISLHSFSNLATAMKFLALKCLVILTWLVIRILSSPWGRINKTQTLLCFLTCLLFSDLYYDTTREKNHFRLNLGHDCLVLLIHYWNQMGVALCYWSFSYFSVHND
jgi:hypothetical protein